MLCKNLIHSLILLSSVPQMDGVQLRTSLEVASKWAKSTLAFPNTYLIRITLSTLWKNLISFVNFTFCSSDGWVFNGLLCVVLEVDLSKYRTYSI